MASLNHTFQILTEDRVLISKKDIKQARYFLNKLSEIFDKLSDQFEDKEQKGSDKQTGKSQNASANSHDLAKKDDCTARTSTDKENSGSEYIVQEVNMSEVFQVASELGTNSAENMTNEAKMVNITELPENSNIRVVMQRPLSVPETSGIKIKPPQMIFQKVPCVECGKVISSSNRKEHQDMHKLFNTGQMLKCPNCNFKSYYKRSVTRHIKEKHPGSFMIYEVVDA